MTPARPSPIRVRPRVAVAGLWHLGAVTAACVAAPDWPVLAVDPDRAVVNALREGTTPLFEPGLDDLLRLKRDAGLLDFAEVGDPALGAAEIVWITFDTPVDEEDQADVKSVLDRACAVLDNAAREALVVVSSQLPVGSTARLEERMTAHGRGDLRYACVPENLRLGHAIETFSPSDRFVAGARSPQDRTQLAELLSRFCDRVEWMGIESAEMTKHALNAFLATSVAFINEIAGICERVGADAHDVARGLKSEGRIGPRAYLSPGDAFAGGTLARDIAFLVSLSGREGLAADVARGVAASNDHHRGWTRRTLESMLAAGPAGDGPGLRSRRVGMWGLTYKPGTDTLRRSSAVELGRYLVASGAEVRAYDPVIEALPDDAGAIELATSAVDAAKQADALVICTPWPQFRDVDAGEVVKGMRYPLVLDAGGHLHGSLGQAPGVRYARVGRAA